MKISFLGSTNIKNTEDCLKERGEFESFIFCHEKGIESLYRSVISDLVFYAGIRNSDTIILDGLSDLHQPDINKVDFLNFYQKFVWYIFSICPDADIYLISYSKIKRTSSHSYQETLIELKKLKDIKVFPSYMFPDSSNYDDSYLEGICSDIFKTNKPSSNSPLSKVIENLKLKKEFETIY